MYLEHARLAATGMLDEASEKFPTVEKVGNTWTLTRVILDKEPVKEGPVVQLREPSLEDMKVYEKYVQIGKQGVHLVEQQSQKM